MRFTLYTEKTIPQCMAALSERLQTPRVPITGWVDKKAARFSISIATRLIGALPLQRVTRLDADCTREQGLTVIRGSVSEGVPPRVQPYVLAATAIVSLLLVLVTQIAAAVGVFVVGVLLYRMLHADWLNSDKLLLEVERTLKASPKRPKAPDKTSPAGGSKKPAAPKR